MLALRVWVYYNQLILDFVRSHPTRSILFEFPQLAQAPGACMVTVGQRLGIALSVSVSSFRPELSSFASDEAHVALVHALNPRAGKIYAELCSISGSDSAMDAVPTERGLMRVYEQCLGQWAVTAGHPQVSDAG